MVDVYGYIRYSTSKQSDGHSRQRQQVLIDKFISNNNDKYRLVKTIVDEGVSGYTGKNVRAGNLAKFIKQVESKQIKKGSILAFENYDRLSRLPPKQVTDVISSMERYGIKVLTLDDNTFHGEDNTLPSLILPILKMYSANTESSRKSDLIKKKKIKAREEARESKKILTSRCPAWLEVKVNTKGEKKFRVIRRDSNGQNREKIIREMFEMYMDGMGVFTIAKHFNLTKKYKPFGNGKRTGSQFHQSYINKVLTNRAVIGEYQPYEREDNPNDGTYKRIPCGDPIPYYYPRVITDTLFNAVQKKIKDNSKKDERKGAKRGGRTGAINNLITGIAKCGYCGGSMYYEDKKYGGYLICRTAVTFRDQCNYTKVRYAQYKGVDYLEHHLLNNLSGITVEDLRPPLDDGNDTMSELKTERDSLDNQIDEIQIKIKNAVKFLTGDYEQNLIDDMIVEHKELSLTLKELQKERTELVNKIDDIKNNSNQLKLDNIKSIMELIYNTSNDIERIKYRRKLRELICEIVKEIKIYGKSDIDDYHHTNRCFIINYKEGGQQFISLDTGLKLIDTTGLPLQSLKEFSAPKTMKPSQTKKLIQRGNKMLRRKSKT